MCGSGIEQLETSCLMRIEGEPHQLAEFIVELARLAGVGGTVNNYLLSDPVNDRAGFGIKMPDSDCAI